MLRSSFQLSQQCKHSHEDQTNLSNIDFLAAEGGEGNVWAISTLANIEKSNLIVFTSDFENHVRCSV
jgi:hypothetical protein